MRGTSLPIRSFWRKTRQALAAVILADAAPSQPARHLSPPSRITIAALALALASATALAPATAWGAAAAIVAIVFSTLFAGWPLGLGAWVLSNGLGVLLLPSSFTASGAPGLVAAIGLVAIFLAHLVRGELVSARTAHARLLALAAAASETVFVADGNGRLLETYGERDGLFGWDAVRGHGWMRTLHPDDRQRVADVGAAQDGLLEMEARFRANERSEWRWYRVRAAPLRGQTGDVSEWVGAVRDVHDRKRESERRELALSEARHRLKNLIAIIEALAKYSGARPGAEPALDAFLKRFSGRLHALAAAGDLLLARSGAALEVSEVVRAALEPFLIEGPQRFTLDGPEVELSEHLGGALALAVHELATNAIKYGALSVPSGRVSVSWRLEPTRDGDEFGFTWRERGGPMAVPPAREGFGTRLIRTVAAGEKDGRVTIDYAAEGLECRISCVREPAA